MVQEHAAGLRLDRLELVIAQEIRHSNPQLVEVVEHVLSLRDVLLVQQIVEDPMRHEPVAAIAGVRGGDLQEHQALAGMRVPAPSGAKGNDRTIGCRHVDQPVPEFAHSGIGEDLLAAQQVRTDRQRKHLAAEVVDVVDGIVAVVPPVVPLPPSVFGPRLGFGDVRIHLHG